MKMHLRHPKRETDMMNALTIATIDNEPRILDTDLAANLGMARPRDIRANVISPNRAELEAFGVLRSMNAKSTDPLGRGRPTKSFYLNEEQALLVCLLSRTERAKAVRAEVIRVFTAYRRGDLVAASAPQLPNFMDPGEAAIAWGEQFKARQLAETRMLEAQKEAAEQAKAAEQVAMVAKIATEKLVEAAPKVDFYDTLVEAEGCITSTEAAALLGWSARLLHEKLEACKHIKRIHGKVGGKRASGWRFTPEFIRLGRGMPSQHEFCGRVTHQLLWTPKGVAWLQARAVSAPVNRCR
ncbi:hypothetical protein EJV44_15370 [Ancylobacter aquaticus]|nr:hypothetical protein EJV44_15370 [Ancylobacter aquaticus]